MDYKQVRVAVKLLIETEQSDGLSYYQCPVCDKESKLMVGAADEGGHWYKCLSAHCDTSGRTEYDGKPAVPTTEPRKNGRNIYLRNYQQDQDYSVLTDTKAEKLTDRFNLRPFMADKLCNGLVLGRHIYPIYGPLGEQRGHVARSYIPGTTRKSLLRPYVDAPEPMQSWYFTPSSRAGALQSPAICIVEDQVSAIRMSHYLPTVALLGTSVSRTGQDEIERVADTVGAERICVILDQDAQMQAIDLAHKFSGKGVAIPIFHEDLKDMEEPMLKRIATVCRGIV